MSTCMLVDQLRGHNGGKWDQAHNQQLFHLKAQIPFLLCFSFIGLLTTPPSPNGTWRWLTNSNARVRIGSLHELFALMPYHPVGIDLCCSFGIQMDHLELSEVCAADAVVLWAHVEYVWDAVVVKVIFACVASSVPCFVGQTIRYCWSDTMSK